MKVLIVDDEYDILTISRLSLARIGGMEVVEALGGSAGIRAAELEKPDVILLDVMMPGLDGPATLEALRSNEATARIPVIFLTAKAMDSEIERLHRIGATGVLTKPFNPLSLPAQVAAILDGARPTR